MAELFTMLNASNLVLGGILLSMVTYLYTNLRGTLSPFVLYYVNKWTTTAHLIDNRPTYYFAALAIADKIKSKRGRFKVETNSDTDRGVNLTTYRGFHFVPGQGLHILNLYGYTCFVYLEKRNLDNAGSNGKTFEESIRIWSPFGDVSIIEKLVNEGHQLFIAKEKENKKIKRYYANYDYWEEAGEVKYAGLENIFLEKKDEIIGNIDEFIGAADWYKARALPYKTGFLFYGPPGTGKTSLIKALAYKNKMSIYSIALSSANITDENLIFLLKSIPEKSILLFEDIDKIPLSHKNPKSKEKNDYSKITLSGLLNALDGINSGEGFITIMTANTPDKIDDALLRPGRIDYKILFDLPDLPYIKQFVDNFYNIDCSDYMDKLSKIHDYGWSMAALQSHCLLNKKSIEDCVNSIEDSNTTINKKFEASVVCEPEIEEIEEIEEENLQTFKQHRFVDEDGKLKIRLFR